MSKSTVSVAPIGTDPRDVEAWHDISPSLADLGQNYGREARPIVLDPAARGPRSMTVHYVTMHGSFTLTYPVKLSPLTQAIIAAAVRRG